MQFVLRKIRFGDHAKAEAEDDGDEGRDLPRPKLLRLQARRRAGIAEAKETLAHLPAPGESLHAIMTARLDMTDVLNALLEKLGRCEVAKIGTLGLNRRNYKALVRMLDAGQIGSLTLLVSRFFWAHNKELFTEMLIAFRQRKQIVAAVDSHAKVMSLCFSNGTRFAVEGSANLCSNGSARENFCIVNDPALVDFHATWISEMAARHEGDPNNHPATG
jgi:hypothetical protein